MRVFKLQYSQTVNASLEEVFVFFSNPENLSVLTPEKLNFKILTPTPIVMKEGQIIDYTIKLLGFNVRWRTIISEYNGKNKFVDQQLKGPYSMWHHTHEFKELNGSINMIDTISYVMPFGILGQIVNKFWVKRDLDNIFKYRQKAIMKYFNERKKILIVDASPL